MAVGTQGVVRRGRGGSEWGFWDSGVAGGSSDRSGKGKRSRAGVMGRAGG